MRKQFLIAIGFVISTAASAQEWRPSIEKWRSSADAAAARYSKSTETAQQVARLAALACSAEKKQAIQLSRKSKASALPPNTLKRPSAIISIDFLSTSSR